MDSSSASSTRGLRASARASVSICCSPPDSRPPRTLSRRSSSGNSAERGVRLDAGHAQVVARRQAHEHRLLLGDEHEAVAGAREERRLGDVAVEQHLAPERRQLAGQGEQRRGLAGAVRPEQRDHLAWTDLDVDVVITGWGPYPAEMSRASRIAAAVVAPVCSASDVTGDSLGHALVSLDRLVFGLAEVGGDHGGVLADDLGPALGDLAGRSRARRCGRTRSSRSSCRARRAARRCPSRRPAAARGAPAPLVSTSPRPAAGSSSSSTLGWVATARAMASSRRCP